jgi:chromosome segregation protein
VESLVRWRETSVERLAAVQQERERAEAQVAAGLEEARARTAEAERLVRDVEERTAAHLAIEQRRADVAERVSRLRAERATATERIGRVRSDRERHVRAAEGAARRAEAATRRARALAAPAERLPRVLETLAAAAERAAALRRPEGDRLADLDRRGAELAAALARLAAEAAALDAEARTAAARATTLEVEAAQVEERLAEALRRRRELVASTGLEAIDRVEPLPADELELHRGTLERLERRQAALGPVNPLAAQEYEEAKARASDVAEQIGDLEGALRELRRLIRELTVEIRGRFDETFADVQTNFAEVVAALFPGGRGRLRLVAAAEPHPRGDVAEADDDTAVAVGQRPDEPDEPGVELDVQPAGKQITSLGILSGGEKALGAIAFLFALMLARPCPFYVLDEVEAALDDANIERFLRLLDRFRDRAQFIVITHQQRTMGAADVLYGVTMAGDGVSKVLSRRLPQAAEDRRALLEPA